MSFQWKMDTTMTKLRFLHFRFNAFGMLVPAGLYKNLIRNGGFYPSLENNGGYTVAYVFSEEKDRLFYAIARCSSRDQYNKKVGCRIAADRLVAVVGNENIVRYLPSTYQQEDEQQIANIVKFMTNKEHDVRNQILRRRNKTKP